MHKYGGDGGTPCYPTCHHCMYPVTSSITTIDNVNICGMPFCILCLRLHKMEGSTYCPIHHPSIKDTTTSMPLVSIVGSDSTTNKVPIKGTIVKATNEIKCWMMKLWHCVIKMEAGGF